MRHAATLAFRYHEPIADAVARALQPEAAQAALDETADPPRAKRASEVPKTRSEIHRERDAISIHIAADDLPSLRASVNSHLRWIDAAARAARLAR